VARNAGERLELEHVRGGDARAAGLHPGADRLAMQAQRLGQPAAIASPVDRLEQGVGGDVGVGLPAVLDPRRGGLVEASLDLVVALTGDALVPGA
jgi:hypothetical protein